jgi:hypothetical protein
LGLFFETGFVVFRVVCTNFLGAALGAFEPAPLGRPAFALGFCRNKLSEKAQLRIDSPSSRTFSIEKGCRATHRSCFGREDIRVVGVIEDRRFIHQRIVHDCEQRSGDALKVTQREKSVTGCETEFNRSFEGS